MRILILNWRDVRSPRGGGAERVTHEVARRLVERRHEVVWLSSAASGLPREETIDGVELVRRGSEASTRLHARRLAQSVRPDVVLEEINTLPYFAPAWSHAPVVLYMNQLAREVWWYEAHPVVAAVGWFAEPVYLRAYRSCDAVTISRSSRDDLRGLGLRHAITIAPMAVDAARVGELGPRSRAGRMLAIGRLTPSKRYDHAIEALLQLRRDHPGASLTLVGEGRERGSLEELARKLGVADAVIFAGRVSEAEKVRLIDEADVLVGTSAREGWGLTVTEAAARGTASIVYDIPGFRDAVVDGRTGLVVPASPAALARAVSDLVDDPERFDRLRVSAWRSAAGLSYDATADAFERALTGAVARSRGPRGKGPAEAATSRSTG
jgi:glycosyltransferase involved in cell wall biosynthesis